MIECPGCGRAVEPGAVECRLCGEDLSALGTGTRQPVQLGRPLSPAESSSAGGLASPVGRRNATSEPPSYGPVRQFSSNAVIAAAVVVLLVTGGIGYYLVTRHSDRGPGGMEQPRRSSEAPSDPAPTYPLDSTPSETPWTMTYAPSTPTTGYPSLTLPGHECGRLGIGPYAAAASGNDYTSCPFAMNVRDAYVQSGSTGATVSVNAHSPTMKQWYPMQCSGDQPVTCEGGNDAVVYLYGGTATFTG